MPVDFTTNDGLLAVQAAMIKVAYEAGRMIIAASPTRGGGSSSTSTSGTQLAAIDAGTKKNSVDLVTETDRGVEKLVRQRLTAAFPEISFLGEESYVPGQSLTEAATFIVDPIDGTTNFVHGYPYCCISLGLALDRKPVVGVVFNPYNGHLYRAARGCGAFLTAPELDLSSPSIQSTSEDGVLPNAPTVSLVTRSLPLVTPTPALPPLSSALVAVEWGYDRSGVDFQVKRNTISQLARASDGVEQPGAMVHSLRSFGAAALNICAVASGQLDAYWEAGCWAWDVCAGWCILSEAGGVIVDTNPGIWTPSLEQRRYFSVRPGKSKPGSEKAGDDVPNHITPESRRFIEEFWSHVQGKHEVGPQ